MNATRRLTWTLAAVAILAVGSGVAGAAIIDNLVSYWPMDGTVADIWGGYTSTHTGGTEDYTAAKFGQGILLDGGTEQIEVQEVGQYDFGAMGGGFTISAWFSVNNFDTSWQALVAKGEGNEFRVHRQSGGNNLAFNAGGGGDLGNPTNVNDGVLHHMVAVHGGGTTNKLWIDGTYVEAARGNVADNNQPLMIGENPDAQNREWEGVIDDVAIWGRPLSDAEVNQIWNGGAGNPISAFMGPITHEVAGDNTTGTETLDGTQSNEVFGPGVTGRFIRVRKDAADGDQRMHLGEIEAFLDGVTPSSPNNLSSNNMLQDGTAPGHHSEYPGTTTNLEHGGTGGDQGSRVHDGAHQSGGAVWSTRNGSPEPTATFTLDMGGTFTLGEVRLWPRNDTCCNNRFRQLHVDIVEDDGSGLPGSTAFTTFLGASPPSPYPGPFFVPLQTLLSANLTASLYPYDHLFGYTYVFELGSADKIEVANPNPSVFTTYLDLNNADIVVELLGTATPAVGVVYDLLDADYLLGTYNSLTLPDLGGGYYLDDSNFLVDGTLVVQFIPEPATLAVWSLLGLMGACVWRRRRKG